MTSTDVGSGPETRGRAAEIPPGRRIPFGEPAYNQVMDFLIVEARLLDDNLLYDWLDLLADDLRYQMPVRATVFRREGQGFDPGMNWIYDDRAAIGFKVRRYMETDTAWAEDPPSRVRRFVSNMTLYETSEPDAFQAQSYLLLQRSRGEAHLLESLSARRDDLVRRTPQGLRLAARTILLDQATLGMANLAVFL